MINIYRRENLVQPEELLSFWENEVRDTYFKTGQNYRELGKYTIKFNDFDVKGNILKLTNRWLQMDMGFRDKVQKILTHFGMLTSASGPDNKKKRISAFTKETLTYKEAHALLWDSMIRMKMNIADNVLQEFRQRFLDSSRIEGISIVPGNIPEWSAFTETSAFVFGLARQMQLWDERGSRLKVNDTLLFWIWARENGGLDVDDYLSSINGTIKPVVINTTNTDNTKQEFLTPTFPCIINAVSKRLDTDGEQGFDLALGFGQKHFSNFAACARSISVADEDIFPMWLESPHYPWWLQSWFSDLEIKVMIGSSMQPLPTAKRSALVLDDFLATPVIDYYYRIFWSGQGFCRGNAARRTNANSKIIAGKSLLTAAYQPTVAMLINAQYDWSGYRHPYSWLVDGISHPHFNLGPSGLNLNHESEGNIIYESTIANLLPTTGMLAKQVVASIADCAFLKKSGTTIYTQAYTDLFSDLKHIDSLVTITRLILNQKWLNKQSLQTDKAAPLERFAQRVAVPLRWNLRF